MEAIGAMNGDGMGTAVRRRTVSVVGGGIAGLACALAAAQAGADVRLHEAQATHAPSSAHIDVVPSMLRGLVRLGVANACVRAGFPYRETSLLGQRGQPLFSHAAERLGGDRYPAALGIAQDALQGLLADAAVHQGVRLGYGERITHIGQGPGGQARLQAEGGGVVAADLAVLACGAGAALRAEVFQAEPAAPHATGWAYLLARRPRGLDDALLAVTAGGDKAHVVPLSGSTVGVRLACPGPGQALDATAAARLLARFPAPIAALANHLLPGAAVTVCSAGAALLPPDWWRGAVLAVGDCAHALPPHFGQSAAQAVEDAVVLGEELARGADLAATAAAFLRRRVPRVQQVMAIVQQAARWDAAPERDTDLLQLASTLDQVVRAPA